MRPWSRLRAWLLSSRLERELREEIEAHREMLEEELRRTGLPQDEAHAAASRRFGNATASLDSSREQWRVQWIDSVAADVRFALRLVRRQPLLTTAAILTIALGVGANTAVTSVLRTALLNPLGLPDADQVVVVGVNVEKLHFRNIETSAAEFRDITAMPDTFAVAASMEGRAWTWEDNGEASRLLGRAVTPGFFRVFNERPALGRFFTADDRDSLVMSYPFWRSKFGGDRAVIGRAVMLDGRAYRVVGVAPEHFRVPAQAEAWSPLILDGPDYQRRGYNMMETVFARLKPGVSLAQARDRVNRYVAGLGDIGYEGYGYSIGLRPFGEYVAGDLRRPLLLVWIAALLVLLTGCANVAGLLLARSAGRKKEIAIRFSLGASGVRVLRQLLVESVVLGVLGGIAGLALATGGVALARRLTIPGGQMLRLVHLDGRLIAYGLLISLVTALLFGLAPALQLLRRDQSSALVRSRRRFQTLFVSAEVASASLLLVLTLLLLRSLWAVEQVRPGFNPAQLTTAFLTKPRNDPTFLDRLRDTLRSSPGVESAALAFPLPFAGGDGLTSTFSIRNRTRQPGEPEWHGTAFLVSPGYFRTMGIRLQRGRDIADSDSRGAPLVCLIDADLAARFFPGQDPIGQEIGMYAGWARVVGVASPVRGALEGLSRPVVYYSIAQIPFFPQAIAVVRSTVPAMPIIRRAVHDVNRHAPLFDGQSMKDRIRDSLGVRRVIVDLLMAFAAITMLLSAIGLHSVIAQIVGERTPEIGVRMALGARPAQILRQFAGQGFGAGAVGLAAGIVAALCAQGWLRGLLYEVQPSDPATFIAASTGLMTVLAFAVWLPARRASRIDPQHALRHE